MLLIRVKHYTVIVDQGYVGELVDTPVCEGNSLKDVEAQGEKKTHLVLVKSDENKHTISILGSFRLTPGYIVFRPIKICAT